MAISAHRLSTHSRFVLIVLPVLMGGVLADQASKSWASVQAAEPCILVPGYLAAYSVTNAGMTLGVGKEQSQTSVVLALLSLGCAGLLVRLAYRDWGCWRGAECAAAGLLLAGILGNTADRLALGHVRDFLVTWAIPTLAFNLADLLVIVGCASLLLARIHDGWRVRHGMEFLVRAAA